MKEVKTKCLTAARIKKGHHRKLINPDKDCPEKNYKTPDNATDLAGVRNKRSKSNEPLTYSPLQILFWVPGGTWLSA